MARRFVMGIMLLLAAGVISGCAMAPGGIAPSTTPLEGRRYRNMGRALATDSRVYLLGFLPVTGANSIRNAIEKAVDARRGDAMIGVTIEFYTQWWILFTRYTTRVEGDVIRFE